MTISDAITISNGTTLGIYGSPGAVIDGGDAIQLFWATSASIYLSGLGLEHGKSETSDAVSSFSSTVSIVNCNVTSNHASTKGGAIAGTDDTAILLYETIFSLTTLRLLGGVRCQYLTDLLYQ